MRIFRKLILASVLGSGIAWAPAAVAQEPDDPENPKQHFGGLEFGIGISFSVDWGGDERVAAAVLDPNGIVRVTRRENGNARIMLESHYFFGLDKKSAKDATIGIGPFVALQPGTDDIIEAVAIGGMVGFRYNENTTQSFNLGFGLVVDPNTQLLGEGITANQPLPAGETVIRYREEYETGWLVLASFSF